MKKAELCSRVGILICLVSIWVCYINESDPRMFWGGATLFGISIPLILSEIIMSFFRWATNRSLKEWIRFGQFLGFSLLVMPLILAAIWGLITGLLLIGMPGLEKTSIMAWSTFYLSIIAIKLFDDRWKYFGLIFR